MESRWAVRTRNCGGLSSSTLGELWFFGPSPLSSSYFWTEKRMQLPWSWEWLDPSDLKTMTWPEHVGEPRRLAQVCVFLGGSEALFRGLCGPAGTLHNAGISGCQVQPTIGNLFIALMTPQWIHLETDLLMSGDRAGTAPREACRASSPGGAKGVWSETGRAGK